MVNIELSEEELKRAIAFYLKAKCGVPVDEETVQNKTDFVVTGVNTNAQLVKTRVKLEVEDNFQQGPYH